MFKITEGRGFHITFANGYTASVQWGPGNYCNNYGGSFAHMQEAGENGSATADIAAWKGNSDMLPLPEPFSDYGDTVAGWQSPEQVLAFLTWVSSLP